jgi:hypothetical protein
MRWHKRSGVQRPMDQSNAEEWSDDIRYSAELTSLAYGIAMNYFIHDLSH